MEAWIIVLGVGSIFCCQMTEELKERREREMGENKPKSAKQMREQANKRQTRMYAYRIG